MMESLTKEKIVKKLSEIKNEVIDEVLSKIKEVKVNNKNTIVAGGYVADTVIRKLFNTPEEIHSNSDIDMFVVDGFLDTPRRHNKIRIIPEKPEILFDAYHGVIFQDNVSLYKVKSSEYLDTIPELNVSYLIQYKSKCPLHEIIKSFDINACQCGIYNEELYYTDDFIDFLIHRKLKIVTYYTPVHSFIRIIDKFNRYRKFIPDVEFDLRNEIEPVLFILSNIIDNPKNPIFFNCISKKSRTFERMNSSEIKAVIDKYFYYKHHGNFVKFYPKHLYPDISLVYDPYLIPLVARNFRILTNPVIRKFVYDLALKGKTSLLIEFMSHIPLSEKTSASMSDVISILFSRFIDKKHKYALNSSTVYFFVKSVENQVKLDGEPVDLIDCLSKIEDICNKYLEDGFNNQIIETEETNIPPFSRIEEVFKKARHISKTPEDLSDFEYRHFVEEITTYEQIEHYARIFQNCLKRSNYFEKIIKGKSLIFVIDYAGKKSIIEIEPDGFICQHRSYRNSNPPLEHIPIAYRLTAYIIEKRLKNKEIHEHGNSHQP